LPAIEQSIFAGVPVNVTLLSPHEQYELAAEVYRQAIGRSGQGLVGRRVDQNESFKASWTERAEEKIMHFPESAWSSCSLGSLCRLLRFD
jgi:transaldolase